MFKKKLATAAVIAISSLAALPALAATTAPDFTSLTAAVDFSTVNTAVLAISAILAGVFVAIRGAKTVLGMIRGR